MNRSVRDAGGRRAGEVVFWGTLCSAAVAAAMLRPPSSAFARPRLSDIHAEYVKYLSGTDTITAYLAYPERRDAAPGVIVIHEIFGLSDFVRQTTERLANDGFVAVAPDLLSRSGGTAAAGENVRSLISSLPKAEVAQDLDATLAYLKTLKSVRGDRIGTIGFCWGGGQSFQYAAHNPDLRAFVVCYGPSPTAEEVARIRAKGLGVYAENDARINANLPALDTAVRQTGKDYQYAIYPGTGHGFIRSRDNPAAADSAWRAIVAFFRTTLER